MFRQAHKGSHKVAKEKVFVGMSGGVDSSVSAATLKKAGYDVTGVFIKVWQPDWIECNWKEERLEAMRAAAHLGISFVTLDLEKEYKKEVIDYMIDEYRAGRTPNPDVMCNRYVKFGAFWKWAEAQGARYIATGHYARARSMEKGEGRKEKGERSAIVKDDILLRAGVDTNKDQSYFLWTLTRSDLVHTLFPVGHLTKPEVRKLAQTFGLPNAEKKDSQGLCFIGKVDVKEFLSHYIKPEPGLVLNEIGETIGTHSGSAFLTIGERHGFTITKKSPNDLPFYISSKDTEKNTVTVSTREDGSHISSASDRVRIGKVSWVSEKAPEILADQRFNLQARSRYRQPLQNILIESVDASGALIRFEKAQDTLTPGQSLVIYDDDICLGGGVIE